jgi:hypothetical protein
MLVVLRDTSKGVIFAKNSLTIPFLVALSLTIPREIPEEPLTNQRG